MYLSIETAECIYKTQFKYFQVEITGKCNMFCKHCRASLQLSKDMETSVFRKVIKFGKRYLSNDGEVVVSGGEPLVNKNWKKYFQILKEEGIECVSITSNGLLFTEDVAIFLKELSFKNICITFSLDSINKDTHNSFRRNNLAYDSVLRAIKICQYFGLRFGIRQTVWDLQEMEGIVDFAEKSKSVSVGFSDIHRFGEAIKHPELFMSKEIKKIFHEKLRILESKSKICLGTNDPLYAKRSLLKSRRSGCGAGVFTFNVNVDGSITPCAFIPHVIFQIQKDTTVKQIALSYTESNLVKKLLEMELSGKCSLCAYKETCGGCRARAFQETGDLFGEDPHCYY